MSSNSITNNGREIVFGRDTATGFSTPLTVTGGNLNVNASISVSTPTTTNTPVLTNVASNATTISLLVSNVSRKQATFFNDSTQVLYLKLGASASATSYTIAMAAASYYELPQPIWTGAIDGIWASANGNARITEVT